MGIFGNLLLGVSGLLAVLGLLMIWVPVIGVLLLVLSAAVYFLAQAVRREARKIAVRRQQGGDWLP